MTIEPPDHWLRRVRLGKYHIQSHIAAGSMAAVYKARNLETGQNVAVKVLAPEKAEQPQFVERFRREARHLAKVRHPHVVELYEYGEANGLHFLAMEFIDGVDLHQYIDKSGTLLVQEALTITVQVTRALCHLFELGMVHRDIKPSNILISRAESGPRIKLIDFGLARHTSEDDSGVPDFGGTLGTIDYLAPEQAADSTRADVRSDIYSLGCTWYQMLAGAPPFTDESLVERVRKHRTTEAPDIREWHPAVPDDMAHVLHRMLQKAPQDRYQTPADLLLDLLLPFAPSSSVEETDAVRVAGRSSRWTGLHYRPRKDRPA